MPLLSSQRVSRLRAAQLKKGQYAGRRDANLVSNARRIKPGSWYRSRREVLLLSNVFTLVLMLIIVHLPRWGGLSDFVRLTANMEVSYQVGYDELSGMVTAVQTRWTTGTLSGEENPVPEQEDVMDVPSGEGSGMGPMIPEPVTREEPPITPGNVDVAEQRIQPLSTTGAFRSGAREHMMAAAPKVLAHTLKLPDVATSPQLMAETMRARYPREGLRDRTQGLVILRFIVEPDGRVSSIRVDQSLSPEFDNEAIRAIQNARFRPGEDGGQPVPTATRLAFRFVVRH